MRLLKDYFFEASYSKTRHEIFNEFYKPCMESSVNYDRVSGYFGSSVFVVINDALKQFINNDGHIRIICSPVLTDDDYYAIKDGYLAIKDDSLNKVNINIQNEINKTLDEMANNFPKATLLLYKLISSGYLELKLAVFGDNPEAYRLLHDKVGIFTDIEKNSVCFRGSFNETFNGLSFRGNSESFDANTSWGEENEKIKNILVLCYGVKLCVI